ncbi:hypothetical protein [Neptunomonas antarctica]|uniref:Uncharacterized protein n=1 Tax=Neptunomonas antarctica TaxID=619304 RepID=A0A1N7IZN2_9GAMM|nr:hypothetical protein [Neptunomonas antarctica]SIS42563.1 hypothetical protein SAMN05421760_101391 [Neptunomonas antarctica]
MNHKKDWVLFISGFVLIILPLIFVVTYTEHFVSVQFYLRLIASLGGALIGASLPGFLNIRVLGVEAGGALAILVLFYLFNPPAALKEGLYPESVVSDFPGGIYQIEKSDAIYQVSTPISDSDSREICVFKCPEQILNKNEVSFIAPDSKDAESLLKLKNEAYLGQCSENITLCPESTH